MSVAPGDASNTAVSNVVHSARCVVCNVTELSAVAWYLNCVHSLYRSCAMAHNSLSYFHRYMVLTPREPENSRCIMQTLHQSPVSCLRHNVETLHYCGRSCDWTVCEPFVLLEQPRVMHNMAPLSGSGPQDAGNLSDQLDGVLLAPERGSSTLLENGYHL
ncbi:hypothetical protein HPB48_012517 [Haemaphysalis longicornis]|uniref:Uncharacterized protein n=1 Tax=Haemaphysalis longicornis TaxID=44386 RepID=A0A9J6GYW0_HAELO|nr:hypothetical protein HPB48_012517 [Haemaphysalis longicornis]